MNKYVEKLRKLENAVTERHDPFAPANLLRSSSPSFNWLFGRTHGFPRGYSILLWGKPKAGKSLISYDLAGQFHQANPDGIVVKFDTEMRDDGQLTPEMAAAYGIDLDRWVVFESNKPEGVFDRFSTEINAMCQDGANIGLCIMDSVNGIMGRRTANQTSISTQQMGDHALTMKLGLQQILECQRKNKIGLILTAHAAAEMDMWEQKRGNKIRAAVAMGTQHHCEFFVNVERNAAKAGSQDELERKLEDESKKGLDDSAEQTGHKIKCWMQDNTFGVKNRVGEFTFNYNLGIINQHEELFRLGTRWGVIQRPNNKTYVINGTDFNGKPNCLEALATRSALREYVTQELMALEGKPNTQPTVLDDEVEKEFAKAAAKGK